MTSLRRGWARYRQIDRSERRQFWYALFHLARLRWRLSRVPLARLLEAEQLVAVSDSAAPLPRLSPEQERRARTAVARAARALPIRTTCLVRALTEIRLLRRDGLHAELCIGFRRAPQGELAGHAWVPRAKDSSFFSASYGIAARYRLPLPLK